MITENITQEAFINMMEVRTNLIYTDEQKALISSFGDGPLFCFADPGTGKTFTAIGGLLNAELFKHIRGDNIYALSFTRMATGELATRHNNTCRKLGIKSTINFATLHKLCKDIILENYRLLDMYSPKLTEPITVASCYNLVDESCREWGIALQPAKIRAIINACRSLNAALIFDEDNVRSKADFKKCGVDYQVFYKIRGMLFSQALLTESISISDVLLYTLMLMQKHPEVSEAFKKKCRIMLVDEAQDLSLLHLRVISYLTDCPVFIGDMKQQIYAFNGACQEIVEAFFKLFPNAATLQLTQSFRCKQNIADFATKIILPNKIGGDNFKGVTEGGSVEIYDSMNSNGNSLNLTQICSDLRNDFIAHRNQFSKDILFLFRNNFSAIPVVEELFKNKLPFRVNNYQPAYEVPFIKELCSILKLCEQPHVPSNIDALRYLIPELRGYYNVTTNPIYTICQKTGASPFEVNYQYKDPNHVANVMHVLMEIQEMLVRDASCEEMFNKLLPLYNENWVSYITWRMENDFHVYYNTVRVLLHKTFSKFVQLQNAWS